MGSPPLVPYRNEGGYRYVSATDVIRGTLGANELKERIVLVGTSARGLVDVRATPTREDLPGVEIHASLISGALDNATKSRPAEMLAIAVLTVISPVKNYDREGIRDIALTLKVTK